MIQKLAFSLAAVVTIGLGMQFAEPSSMRLVDYTELENIYGGSCIFKIATMCGDGPSGCEELECANLEGIPCLRRPSTGIPCGIEACDLIWITVKCAFPGGD